MDRLAQFNTRVGTDLRKLETLENNTITELTNKRNALNSRLQDLAPQKAKAGIIMRIVIAIKEFSLERQADKISGKIEKHMDRKDEYRSVANEMKSLALNANEGKDKNFSTDNYLNMSNNKNIVFEYTKMRSFDTAMQNVGF